MPIVLFRFWLRRFTLVFALACATLVLLEWLRHGDNPSYLGAVAWAGAAGLPAASIATYWAYKHGCAVQRGLP